MKLPDMGSIWMWVFLKTVIDLFITSKPMPTHSNLCEFFIDLFIYANTYTKPTQCLLLPARWYRKAAYNGPTRLALLIPRSGRSHILNRSNLKLPKKNKHVMVYESENHNLPCSNCHNLRLQIFRYTNL